MVELGRRSSNKYRRGRTESPVLPAIITDSECLYKSAVQGEREGGRVTKTEIKERGRIR